MSDSQVAGAPAQAQQMTLVGGLMLLGLIIVALVVFEFLGYKVLGLGAEVFFASFTLLWYWATVEKAEFKGLPASVVGALVGLGLAWQSGWFVAHYGMPNGLIMGLLPIVAALFVVLMNWLPIALNGSTMLFLTIMGAPALAKTANFIDLGKAIVLGALFFAAVIYLAKMYVEMRAKSATSKVAVSA